MDVNLDFGKGQSVGYWFDCDRKKSYIYLIYTLTADKKNLDKLIYIGETCDTRGYDARIMDHFNGSNINDPLYKYCKKNNIEHTNLGHKIAYVDSTQRKAVEAALIFANRRNSQDIELQNTEYMQDNSELHQDNEKTTTITISGGYRFKTVSDKTKDGKKIDIIVK